MLVGEILDFLPLPSFFARVAYPADPLNIVVGRCVCPGRS